VDKRSLCDAARNRSFAIPPGNNLIHTIRQTEQGYSRRRQYAVADHFATRHVNRAGGVSMNTKNAAWKIRNVADGFGNSNFLLDNSADSWDSYKRFLSDYSNGYTVSNISKHYHFSQKCNKMQKFPNISTFLQIFQFYK